MPVIEQNYRVEAFPLLLREDCVLSRYCPLIPCSKSLTEHLLERGCNTKSECAHLSDGELIEAGVPQGMTGLFRAFLSLYDIDTTKLKAAAAAEVNETDRQLLLELLRLPGVQITRAMLYLRSGYTSLQLLAFATPEEIIEKTSATVAAGDLPQKPPLPKEARTHIAVARALTEFAV